MSLSRSALHCYHTWAQQITAHRRLSYTLRIYALLRNAGRKRRAVRWVGIYPVFCDWDVDMFTYLLTIWWCFSPSYTTPFGHIPNTTSNGVHVLPGISNLRVYSYCLLRMLQLCVHGAEAASKASGGLATTAVDDVCNPPRKRCSVCEVKHVHP